MTIVAAAHAVSSSAVMPGVLGFLVVAGLSVALVFLLRSMNKQLRKVAPPAPARPAPAAKAAQVAKATGGPGEGAGSGGAGSDGGPVPD